MNRRDDDGRPLVTFHGPVKMHQRKGSEGALEYVIVPLTDASVLELLSEQRAREAWYAGVDAALRAAERLSVTDYPLTLGRLRAELGALRHPKDVVDER